MAYATTADAVLLYGEAQVAVLCDRNGDGVVDASSFQHHLDAAADQMDAYLMGRYPLPLDPAQWEIPAYFKRLNVDIALYNAAQTDDVRTLEITKRNDAALAFMLLIAQNRVKLANVPSGHSPALVDVGRTDSDCGCNLAVTSCGTRWDFEGIL